jgi:hypothetical protein
MVEHSAQTSDAPVPQSRAAVVEPTSAHHEVYTPPASLKSETKTDTGATVTGGERGLNSGDGHSMLSSAEQAARAFRGVISSYDMRINKVEQGLTSQEILAHGGTRFEYDSGKRTDGLKEAERHVIGGFGHEVTKRFEGRADHLLTETRLQGQNYYTKEQVFEPGQGPDGLTRATHTRRGDQESMQRTFDGRADGVVSDRFVSDKKGSTYEVVYADGRGPNGLLSETVQRIGGDETSTRRFSDGRIEMRSGNSGTTELSDAMQRRSGQIPGRIPDVDVPVGPQPSLEAVVQDGMARVKPGDAPATRHIAEAPVRGTLGEQKQPGDIVYAADMAGAVPSKRSTTVDLTDAARREREGETRDQQRITADKTDLETRLSEIRKATSGEMTPEKADLVRRQFQNLTPEQIQEMKRSFDGQNPHALGAHIRDSFSRLPGGLDQHAHRIAEVEGHLNRTGAPGEETAIHLRVAALEAAHAGQSGNRDLAALQADTRRTLLGMSEQQRADVDKSLRQLYGEQHGGLKELYQSGPGKTIRGTSNDYNSAVIDLASRKGLDARTPKEQSDLLHIAHQSGDINNFREAGSKEAMTAEGRKYFVDNGGLSDLDHQIKRGRTTSELYSREQKQEMKEIVRTGEESPLTQFKKGTGVISNVDSALTDAVRRAADDPQLRAQYTEGKRLAESKASPETDEQRQAADYYKQWQRAFKDAGVTKEQRADFERQMTGATDKGDLKENITHIRDQKGLIESLRSASPEERERLRTDSQYRDDITAAALKAASNPASKAVAALLLEHYAKGEQLSAADTAKLNALTTVANQDLSPHQAQRAVINSLRESMKQDKEGTLGAQLLGDENFKRDVGDAVGGERRFNSIVKPLLETGAVPASQLRRIDGVGSPEFFKDAVLDATPQALKRLATPEGKAEREAILGNINNPDQRALAEKIIAQGEVRNQDHFRAFELGIEKQDQALGLLKRLSPEERSAAVTGFEKEYGRSLQEALLAKVDQSNKPTVRLFANANGLTSEQALIQSRELVTDSTSTWLGRQALRYDSTTLNRLADLGAAHRETDGQLTPTQVDERLRAINDRLKSFNGTKEDLAKMITDAAVMAGSLGVAPFTGGTSLGLLAFSARAAALTAGGGLSGAFLKAELTHDYSHFPQDVLKYGAIAGTTLIGAESLTALSGLGGRVAAGTAERAFAEPAIAALQGLTPEIRQQVTSGLTELVKRGFVSGGIKDEAVHGLVNGLQGLSQEAKAALSQSLISNLEQGVKSIASDTLRGALINAGRTARTTAIDGGAGVVTTTVRQIADAGPDVAAIAEGGVNGSAAAAGSRLGKSVLGTILGGRLLRGLASAHPESVAKAETGAAHAVEGQTPKPNRLILSEEQVAARAEQNARREAERLAAAAKTPDLPRKVPDTWTAAADAVEPPVAPGHVRLYRGVRPEGFGTEFAKPFTEEEHRRFGKLMMDPRPQDWSQADREFFINGGEARRYTNGRYFSDTLDTARIYAGDKGKVVYVDVPKEKALMMGRDAGALPGRDGQGLNFNSTVYPLPYEYYGHAREHVLSPTNPLIRKPE